MGKLMSSPSFAVLPLSYLKFNKQLDNTRQITHKAQSNRIPYLSPSWRKLLIPLPKNSQSSQNCRHCPRLPTPLCLSPRRLPESFVNWLNNFWLWCLLILLHHHLNLHPMSVSHPMMALMVMFLCPICRNWPRRKNLVSVVLSCACQFIFLTKTGLFRDPEGDVVLTCLFVLQVFSLGSVREQSPLSLLSLCCSSVQDEGWWCSPIPG